MSGAIFHSIGQIRDLLAKRGYLVKDQQAPTAIHGAFGYIRTAAEGATGAWSGTLT